MRKGLRDLHVHTVFSDGADTVADVVRYAAELGMSEIGISDHSYTPFDTSYCMAREDTERYIGEVRSAAAEYEGRVKVLCGIEQDLFSEPPAGGFDYVIGSAHYIKTADEYIPVDLSADTLTAAAGKYFGGDVAGLVCAYYEELPGLTAFSPDIIGHFDLITKFNGGGRLFDESDPRVVSAAETAAAEILERRPGQIFEINTGAISRGYRKSPYPSRDLMRFIRSKGGRFILSSDSHRKETLCYAFGKYGRYAEK